MGRRLVITGLLGIAILVLARWDTVWGGGQAKDFTLLDLDGRPVSLSGLRGRPVVLCFYFLG